MISSCCLCISVVFCSFPGQGNILLRHLLDLLDQLPILLLSLEKPHSFLNCFSLLLRGCYKSLKFSFVFSDCFFPTNFQGLGADNGPVPEGFIGSGAEQMGEEKTNRQLLLFVLFPWHQRKYFPLSFEMRYLQAISGIGKP